MGLPCVLTDVGGAAEMVTDGTNGFRVPPGSPEMIAAGWHRAREEYHMFDKTSIREDVVRRFNIENCVREYEQILTQRP